MTFVRSLLGTCALTAGLVSAWSLPGCGSAELNNRDFGQPPDPALFNPGSGGGDAYGSGSGSGGSGPEKPFVCPDPLKRCNHTITFPFNGETAVELRGNFGGDSTWGDNNVGTGTPMAKRGNTWSADITLPFGKPIQYKFYIPGRGNPWVIDEAQPKVTNPDGSVNNTFVGKTCEPSLCAEEGALPQGVFDWRDSVMYFVFVDRFFDGNPANNRDVPGVSGGNKSIANYQGGDWSGVTQKINENYFTDLGVNTLWITVPLANAKVAGRGTGNDTNTYSGFHGYWPKVDSSDPSSLSSEPYFGTFAELQELITAAHRKGLKVLFDYAMVGVHDTSQIYQQHKDWFWPNSKDGSPNCVCGLGCSYDNDAERCWFAEYLPHWNYTNSAAREYSVTQAVEWVKQTGVDGFRADAIKHVDLSWLTSLRAKLKTDIPKQTPPQRFYMVGETYAFGNVDSRNPENSFNDARNLIKKYVEPATKLDGQFDFPLRKNIVEALLMRTKPMSELATFMNSNDYFYGPSSVMSTFIGNHDLPRVIHLAANNRLWGDDQASDGKDRGWVNQPGAVSELEAFERVANGFAVLYTNRGVPLVYYGDEIGMPGAGDPDNRRFMQWSGLSANQTYLNERLKKLGDIRKKHPALRRGVRSTLESSADVWAFSRITNGDAVYVAINRSDSLQTVTTLPTGGLTELLTGATVTGSSDAIPPRQARIYVAK